MPAIEDQSTLITLELTQDEGFFYSELTTVDFTTGSSLSLYPKPVPSISMSPKVALRASRVLVHLFGTFADELISCSGLLTPLN